MAVSIGLLAPVMETSVCLSVDRTGDNVVVCGCRVGNPERDEAWSD